MTWLRFALRRVIPTFLGTHGLFCTFSLFPVIHAFVIRAFKRFKQDFRVHQRLSLHLPVLVPGESDSVSHMVL